MRSLERTQRFTWASSSMCFWMRHRWNRLPAWFRINDGRDDARREVSHLAATFRDQTPPSIAKKILERAARGPEITRLAEKDKYLVHPWPTSKSPSLSPTSTSKISLTGMS